MRPTSIHLLSTVGVLTAMALSLAPFGCTANVHDNQADVDVDIDIEKATVSFTSDNDVNEVKVDDSLALNVSAQNVVLVEPTSAPSEKEAKAAGHFQFYFDDINSTPVLITAQQKVSLKVAASLKEGGHKVICRVHKHDGTPTKATFELNFTIKASVTVETDSGSEPADSGVQDSGAPADGSM